MRVGLVIVAGFVSSACAAKSDDSDAMHVAPTLARGADQTEVAPTPSSSSPAVLAELVAKSRELSIPSETGAYGGTRVGTTTGVGGPAETPIPAMSPLPRRAGVRAGPIEVQPAVSSSTIEREARAQIYWRLRNCKRADGTAPPPDSIVLDFTIRPDGTIEPSSVKATTDDLSLESVAACVLRTFSASPFTGPTEGRNASARVVITWPSVD